MMMTTKNLIVVLMEVRLDFDEGNGMHYVHNYFELVDELNHDHRNVDHDLDKDDSRQINEDDWLLLKDIVL
jgi:hypothetical protein